MNKEIPVYNRLAAVRAERGLSRDELAQQLGVSREALGYIELGKVIPSLALALRTSELLAVSVNDIFALSSFGQEKPHLM